MLSTTPSELPRRYLPWLWLLLLAHAALLGWALVEPFAYVREDYKPREFVFATLTTLALASGAFIAWPRQARAIALAAALLLAAGLLTPGAVFVVFACLLNAYVTGIRVLRFAGGATTLVPEGLPPSVPMLAGIAIWISLIGATASLKIHYAPLYAAALLLPLAFGWRDTMAALRRAAALFAPAREKPTITERGWLALLLAVLVVHLFLVARPEAGHDAVTMHLQIAQIVRDTHRFTFDVGRYAWAVMPMGADWAYVAAVLLSGETAARFANLCFGSLAGYLVYTLLRRHARHEIALASIVLLVSTPLAFAESGTLYVEYLWLAFLLAALWSALELARGNLSPRVLWPLLALTTAGAMQCKVIGVLWLAPMLAVAVVIGMRRRHLAALSWRPWLVLAAAVAIGAWPYANAWVRTGNPAFPFMNAWFRSPMFDTTQSFTNPLYLAPLAPWSLYEAVMDSGRFIEGSGGAAGWHWLLLLPLIYVAFARRRPAEQWACAALAIVFFVAVWLQQSYLRYLLPSFALLAVLGGWAANDLPDRPRVRLAILLIGGALCLVQVRFIYTGSWINATLCPGCAFNTKARQAYLAQYIPERVISEWLTQHIPDARVGLFVLNGANPAGFTGYSRAANWHDYPVFTKVVAANSADDIAAIVRQYGLTHAVFRPGTPSDTEALRAFRERDTDPIWQFQGNVVAAIRAAPR